MEKCVFCRAETQTYYHGYPFCINCANRIDAGDKLTAKPDPAKR
jgi:hypothetical protein